MRRRRYLAASGTVIGASLSGCLGSDNGSDPGGDTGTGGDGTGSESNENEDGSNDEESDENEDGSEDSEFLATLDGDYEAVAKWLPAPSVLGVDPYRSQVMAPAGLAEQNDHLEDGIFESIAEMFDLLAVDALDASEIDRLITARYGNMMDPNAPRSLVLEGAVDPATAGTTLEEVGYERVRSDEGYDYYDGEDAAYALADSVLVATLETETLEIVERIVDAERGQVRRYGDENEAIERLAGTLPTGHIAIAGPSESDEDSPIGPIVADGNVMQVDGERTHEGVVLVLEEGTTVDADDVETLIDETESIRSLSGVEYGIDDATVRIHGNRSTTEVEF